MHAYPPPYQASRARSCSLLQKLEPLRSYALSSPMADCGRGLQANCCGWLSAKVETAEGCHFFPLSL